MATLRPFRALRPAPASAAQVAAVPYDVVNREEAAQLARDNPLSFLHVSRPEIDLPPGQDPHSAEVYELARTRFARLRAEAPLELEAAPSLYLYRLTQGAHTQTGIAGTFSVAEYDQGIILRHERTRREKEDDRTRHLLALEAQTGPAYLAYRATPETARLSAEAARARPLYDFVAPDGVRHELWRIDDPALWVRAFAGVPRLYIADGHHRTASASRAHAELSRAAPGADAAHAYFLAVAFPAAELRILPYHRVVKDLGRHASAEAFLEALGADFELREGASPEPARGRLALFIRSGRGPGPGPDRDADDGRWIGLTPRAAPASHPSTDPGAALDVSLLQERILGPLLGITDPRTDPRIDFVGGARGTAELERLVRSGAAAAAFALHPTTLDDLFAVCDAGSIMPPKSTWFEPKLRDGLLSHLIR